MQNNESLPGAKTLEQFLALELLCRALVTEADGVFVKQWFACSTYGGLCQLACASYATTVESAIRAPRCPKHGPMNWLGAEFVLSDGTTVRSKW